MICPDCGDELVYEEYVDGNYVYAIQNGVINWKDGELQGECHGHAVRCKNEDCDYHLSPDAFQQILNRSLDEPG